MEELIMAIKDSLNEYIKDYYEMKELNNAEVIVIMSQETVAKLEAYYGIPEDWTKPSFFCNHQVFIDTSLDINGKKWGFGLRVDRIVFNKKYYS